LKLTLNLYETLNLVHLIPLNMMTKWLIIEIMFGV